MMDPKPALDRRAFLAGTAAAAAAGLGAPVVPTQPTPLPPSPDPRPRGGFERAGHTGVKVACKIGMIQAPGDAPTLADRLKVAADAGFDGVELDSPADLDIDGVLKAKEAAGIEIPGVVCSKHWSHPLSSPNDATREEGIAAVMRAIEDCAAVGGKTVLVVPGVVNAEVDYLGAMRRSAHAFFRLRIHAALHGVGIAIENVWNSMLMSPAEARWYLSEISSSMRYFTTLTGGGCGVGLSSEPAPHVGWYLDIGNLWNFGWPRHWLEYLGPQAIFALDIKGYSREIAEKQGKWAGFDVEIGEGDLPWHEVREWLGATGWSGWAAAEVRGGDLARLTDVAARVRRVLGIG